MNLFRYLVRKREGKGFRKAVGSGQWAGPFSIYHLTFLIREINFEVQQKQHKEQIQNRER
jgi:hypothetical protein